MLNHSPADTCSYLDAQSATATPSPDIREGEPALDELQKVIPKLKERSAAGTYGIPPELLKYAEEHMSRETHELLFHKMWTIGRVPIK